MSIGKEINLEPVDGIEPTFSTWKDERLPLTLYRRKLAEEEGYSITHSLKFLDLNLNVAV